MAQVVRRAQAAEFTDLLDRQVRRLQQALGARQALVEKPLQRGRAGGGLEPPVERPGAERGPLRQVLDGQRPVQVRAGPGQDRGQPLVVGGGHGQVDELGLAAGPVGGYDHTAGELVGDVRAQVAPHQVEAEVEPRGEPGAGEHVAVVHVQHRVVDPYLRVALGELGGVHPVGGGAAPVEEPGLGECEGAGAQGHHAGTGVVGAAQRLGQPRRQRSALLHTGIGHRRDDDRVRAGQVVESVRGTQRQPGRARGPVRAAPLPGAAQPQVVPGVGQVGLRLAEDGAGDAQFVQVPRRDPDLLGHDDRDGTSAHPRRIGSPRGWQEFGAGRHHCHWSRAPRAASVVRT
ncbi:hypothetical protein DF18_34350 [Streptomyces rimosus]|nr:hypothetical protein DF18_34350 [Streptomyces rimosus]